MTQWAALVSNIQSYCEQQPSQPGTALFTAQIPTFVNNAELRIYRELDFLATKGTNASVPFMAGSRTLGLLGMTTNNLPTYPVVVQTLSAVTPAGSLPAAGTRVQFELVSFDFIGVYWPQESVTAAPVYGSAYYAMQDQATIIVAPTPDQAYTAEISGTWRPAPMSASNPETYLGDQFADILLAASMIEATAWMRDWSAMDNDPKMAMSWEAHYQTLKTGAIEEEQRKKGQGPGWEPFSPTPAAKPRT